LGSATDRERPSRSERSGDEPRLDQLILGILGVWRVTHLLNAEDGPGDSFVWLRRLAGNGFWGSLLDCFYCLSLWVAAPFAVTLGKSPRERLLLWLALSAGASLIERQTSREPAPAAPFYKEEDIDGVLRTETTGRGDDATGP
jgi:hypothetical protein